MFKSGEYTSEYVTELDGSTVSEEQIQPVGVELTIDKIFKVRGYTVLKDDEYSKGERSEAKLNPGGNHILKSEARDEINGVMSSVSPEEYNDEDLIHMDNPYYTLTEGPHVVRYNEKITVPEDAVGFVLPRSRLIRSNNMLTTAVWDSGYSGRGEGGLDIDNLTFIEKGMRVGVFVLADATTNQEYDGSHQGENV
jgi:deoxycytidine triphosphate deaminase